MKTDIFKNCTIKYINWKVWTLCILEQPAHGKSTLTMYVNIILVFHMTFFKCFYYFCCSVVDLFIVYLVGFFFLLVVL